MAIRTLAAQVIDQIAAGEVVERPASVVKELVENAVDAGARHVSVRIAEGGVARIEVIDDGCGVAEGEMALALCRHATSKLRTLDDLQAIQSYGFRGEALPAIASVARLSLRSRLPGADGGFALGAGERAPTPCAMPEGTRVTVEDLFFQVPARRKFLSSPAAETRRVVAVLERLALSAPEVALDLAADGRPLLRTTGSGNLLEACLDLFGQEVAAALEPVALKGSAGAVAGLVSRPGKDRGNRQLQFLSVAGRPVAAGNLRFAVESAYQGRLLKGRYPIFCLRLDVPAGDVDVNVHPAKLEVRFRDERAVAGLLHAAVLAALAPRPALAAPPAPPREEPPPERRTLLFAEAAAAAYATPAVAAAREAGAPEGAPPPRGDAPLVLGQALGLFLVAQDGDALYIFDQHAVHERIHYEELADAEQRSAQLLLSPLVVRLTPQQSLALAAHRSDLEAYGFLVEPFGDQDAIVRSVPRIFGREAPQGLLGEVLDALGQGGEDPLQRAERLRREIAACKASVKANDQLGAIAQASLIRRLWACAEPRFCPHGRPTFLRLQRDELWQRLGRR